MSIATTEGLNVANANRDMNMLQTCVARVKDLVLPFIPIKPRQKSGARKLGSFCKPDGLRNVANMEN